MPKGRFLRTRGFAVLAAAIAILAAAVCSGPKAWPSVSHVILFIGDGMSVESEIAASRYLYGQDRALAWDSFPGRAYVSTWDVTSYNVNAGKTGRPLYSSFVFTPSLGYDVRRGGDRPYPDGVSADPGPLATGPATDSASAATALATGLKTDSGNIAWRAGDAPDGGITTIAEELRSRRGGAIGVVTTVPFSHATPAAFVSHNPSRNHYYTGYRGYAGLGIADEIINVVKPDVVIGAGHPLFDNPAFDANKGYISEELYREILVSTDYVLAERKAGVDGGRTLAAAAESAAAQGKKLFGLFGGAEGNFTPLLPEMSPGSPRLTRETAEDPTLGDAVRAALRVLSRNPNGFFLMAEQGDIDWANHDNDYRRMIGCVTDLDEAVRAAVGFVDEPGDAVDWTNTVLIVTADHATGGLRLNPAVRLGAGKLPRQLGRGGQEPEEASEEPAPGNGRHPARPRPQPPVSRSPFFYPDGEASYATTGHTNELVTLAVRGAAGPVFLECLGSWYPGPIIDNTQVNAAMREVLGLGPRQPAFASVGASPPRRSQAKPPPTFLK
jgi:alkaline phosphatase